jgi:hypothetical protein
MKTPPVGGVFFVTNKLRGYTQPDLRRRIALYAVCEIKRARLEYKKQPRKF